MAAAWAEEALPRTDGPAAGHVTLLRHDPDLDVRLLASLLYEHAGAPMAELEARVRALTDGQRRELLDEALRARGPHDAWPAGLEGAMPFEFEVLLDFGAYRDIGRHRKGFQQQQAMTVDHGFAVPPLIELAGLAQRYTAVLEQEMRSRGLSERSRSVRATTCVVLPDALETPPR